VTEAASSDRLVTAGRVGRTHTLDGSFRVIAPAHPLPKGTPVTVAGRSTKVVRRRGSEEQPIVRLEGVSSREAAAALGGELLLVGETVIPLGDGEWLASDLIGCRVEGLGLVERVIDGPSCDVLELSDGMLVPLIADAVRRVDVASREVTVNRAFLGLDPPAP
jgi:16S rRNA processing protein RimM